MKEIVLNKSTPLSRQLPKKVIMVEMFKAGEQMDSDGDKAKFTERDLEDIVQGYDPSVHEAPLIIGHEQNDTTPALGWVREVWRKGNSLWGKIELTPKAEKIISEGTYKKVSSSFYAPGSETNPNKGKLSLRHLALVSIPAVKGLAEFKECISDTITFDFSEQRSQSLFKDLLESNSNNMPRQKTRQKSISNHGEGTVNLTINVSSGDPKKGQLPIYDDTGSMLDETGAPADYQMEYGDDLDKGEAEAMPPASDDGAPPTDDGIDADMPPADDSTDMPDDGNDADVPDDGDGDEPETDDISEEMDDTEDTVSELASKYSAMELLKALAIKKKNSDLMDEDTDSTDADKNFSEGAESEKEDEEEKTEDFACGDSEPDKKEDKEEDKEYAEDEKEPDDDEDDIKKLKERLQFVEDELQKQRKMAREKEISDFCESIYSSGKLVESIVPKKELVKFMSTLNGKNSINFSESNRQSQFDFFSEVLSNLPQVVNFSELATPASAPKKKAIPEKDELSGFAYDSRSMELHAKALDFSEANGVDYVTALKSVL